MTFTRDETQILTEIYQQIENNFKKKIRLNDVAIRYSISISTLIRGYKKQHQKTIQQHRLEKCMAHALEMLEAGKPIKAIKIELGYKTTGSFARAFKKAYGYSPNRYPLQ